MASIQFITCFILLLPALIFIAGFTKPVISIPVLIVYAYWLGIQFHQLLKQYRPFRQKINAIKRYFPELTIAVLATTLWLWPSGIGGIGYIHHDANMTNTTFYHLIHDDWPIWFTPEYLGDKFSYQESRPFVYYIGYYLPAALLGKLLGWTLGELSLFLWTWLCTFLVVLHSLLYIKQQQIYPKSYLYGLFLFLFCLYGGLDWWANSWLHATTERAELWDVPFLFLSNTRLLYWSSHNSLPVWLLMALLLENVPETGQTKLLGPALVSVLIWTPIGLIGVVPFCVLYLLLSTSQQKSNLFDRWSVGLSIVTGLLLATFITSNSFTFPVEWLPTASWLPRFTVKYLLFLGTELITTVGVFLLTQSRNTSRETRFILLAYSLLLLIPFVRLGIWNDWCSKTSMAALFVVSFLATKNAVSNGLPPWKQLVSIVLLFISTFTGGEELLAALQSFSINVHVVPHEFRDYGQYYVTEQRIGKPDSFFFRLFAKESGSTQAVKQQPGSSFPAIYK
ncbi:hypothetical protein [Spirosoma endbachense]|uniref:Uncharacterized protein n=1 Tax=Spirosoma endbachense TaxID=2666025 RepID=A0A6P1VZ82_9BACT|nr:hypothetical protein [Spirosoma endbachense]QHV97628.1 hypothetical protein GJR95_22620 [Spirosoma endbachense]